LPAAALPWIRELNAAALRPDLVVVLDVGAEVAAARRRARGGPEELFERRELQAKLAVAYLEAEHFAPSDQLAHLDGTLAVSAVSDRLLALVRAKFQI